MIHAIVRKLLFCFIFVSFLLVIGCSKLTTENYDQLRTGMDYDGVIALLGEADECDGAIGLKNCMWGNDQKHINVNFAADKVVMFSGKGL